ncbi:hypothetical protein GIB67_036359 [Kingdonia uniflora]|uniref:AB hydrolase-1 domain-containing protein n=1 Tax=Kingdonia uniflora TaxID=39325 RepID=A0A7J7L430_9MAGN|nr:hypothetical protein GIB67_036359 [Kingdonia uniflora]
MQILQSDLRSALQIAAAATFCYLNNPTTPKIAQLSMTSHTTEPRFPSSSSTLRSSFTMARRSLASSSSVASEAEKKKKMAEKPLICTADELHYVSVPNTKWRLALWRYTPCPKAPPRNHPLLLLSGVGTNAIGFDLSPESSFARHMSSQGFDTWILEVRGAGLSTRGEEANNIEPSLNNEIVSKMVDATTTDIMKDFTSSSDVTDSSALSEALAEVETSTIVKDTMEIGTVWDESVLVAKLSGIFMSLSERLSGFLNEGQSKIMSAKLLDQMSKLLEDTQLSERFNETRERISGLLEARQNSAVANQIRDLSERLVNIIEDSQRSVSPQLFDLQARFSTTINNFQKQLDLIVHYDWDFDHYLEEDVPAAVRDRGLLLTLIFLQLTGEYFGEDKVADEEAVLKGFEGKDSGLAAVVTLASSVDYTSSKSSLKLLIPLADPAQVLNVPVVPLGALLAAAQPLTARPPYVWLWLKHQISATDMMHPELLEKLILNNFCTIPAKVLIQLATAFRDGGLRDRSGTFSYKDHLQKSDVPVLAVAGDHDLICPPEAVYETVKIIPQHLVTYKVFGEQGGPHYAHYDLVGGRLAVDEVFPCIVEFLISHDAI